MDLLQRAAWLGGPVPPGSQAAGRPVPGARGFFSLVILSPEEDERALDKINYFNTKFREQLNTISSLPQGRWLWVRIEDHTDFVGLRLLLDFKRLSDI